MARLPFSQVAVRLFSTLSMAVPISAKRTGAPLRQAMICFFQASRVHQLAVDMHQGRLVGTVQGAGGDIDIGRLHRGRHLVDADAARRQLGRDRPAAARRRSASPGH